ncbi:unnamed protein product [Rhizophagus irregularis]|uniref:DNA2/NAM7 helicase-like C-terminal domain-containing protein n=1 Tax=Rhizophagus irregularis TaxID=588596 RepID=A0A2N1MYK2_9GLOM|nr:hypothetical protein RhiirC2_852689 [Rhizophagus irregularis]CAB4387425.1 unnamed protein product [Rhizophagus irregularis]
MDYLTPFRRQRLEIKSRLEHYIKNENLQINTVDKIQGQEADIVIACFGFFNINKTSKESKFLFEMNRWNVALSRAKSKLIVITTNEMLDPDDIEIFANKKISEGLEFFHMVKNMYKMYMIYKKKIPLSIIVKEKGGGKK